MFTERYDPRTRILKQLAEEVFAETGSLAGKFTVLFAIARTAGWLVQYRKRLGDPEQSIARPRQIYEGENEREYVAIEAR